MSNQELVRTRAKLRELDADWALLSSPENVTYVSHYEVPIDFGPLAHLNYGPVLALFGVQEEATLLVANRYYADAARQQSTFDEVIGFGILEVFAPFDKQDRYANFVMGLRQALQHAGLGGGKLRLAVEERTLPLVALQVIRTELPQVELVAADDALARVRMIKTPREIGLLKAAAEVVNVAHKELMRGPNRQG
ncbi:MAG: aminopeptidase P family N-terminal domain-containing protein [Caldilineaceae bacterium]